MTYQRRRERSGYNKESRTTELLKNIRTINYPKIGLGCCFVCGEYHCTNKFCKEHSVVSLLALSNKYGLDSSLIGTSEIFDEFSRIKFILYDLYWNKGMSVEDIANYYKIPLSSITLVYRDMEMFGIPRRTFSESISNAILSGKKKLPETNSQTGLAKNINKEWHTAWTGEDVFLRSSYELDYAEYLDSNQISYSVEELRIEYFDSQQNKTRIAIPDFYISSTNEIIEIKLDFTLDIQEMLDKFKAYKDLGYIPKLILEGKEVDIYNIEEEVNEVRLYKIKNKNLSTLKNKAKSKDDVDMDNKKN